MFINGYWPFFLIDYLDIGNRLYIIYNEIVFDSDLTPACYAERSLSVVKHLW
jgi:hypothetical protein